MNPRHASASPRAAFRTPGRALTALLTAPLLALAATLILAACSASGPQFAILSGSENDVLEPMVQEFCKSRGATCTMRYQGSLDIALSLKPGNDRRPMRSGRPPRSGSTCSTPVRRVKSVKSIAQMPVILGVRRSKAQALGWIGAR